jgi:hypothetical protein
MIPSKKRNVYIIHLFALFEKKKTSLMLQSLPLFIYFDHTMVMIYFNSSFNIILITYE